MKSEMFIQIAWYLALALALAAIAAGAWFMWVHYEQEIVLSAIVLFLLWLGAQ